MDRKAVESGFDENKLKEERNVRDCSEIRGGTTETDKKLLWSYDLSTVTSSTVFNAQTITLNDNVANYNLIEVVLAYDIRGLPNTFLGSYPDADTDCDGNLNVHIPKYIIGKTRFAVNTTLKLSSNKSTAGYRYRNITRKSDTTVEFGSGYQTGTKYEFVMVPIRIYGIK